MSSPERKTSAGPKKTDPADLVARSAAERRSSSGPVVAFGPGHGGGGGRRSRSRSGFAVSRDGTRIYYEVSGRHRPATTLLLCDGIGCDGYVWKYLSSVLGDEYRLIHLHYRGHGQTPAPDDPARVAISDLSDDVVAVMEACETESAVLCGHSMGVQVSLETYRRACDRVLGLVLICGSYGNPLRTFKGKSTLEELLPALRFAVGRMPHLVTAFWTRLIPTELAYQIATNVEINGPLIRREDFFPYLEGMSRIDVRLFLNMLAAAGRHTAKEILPQVRVPTLIVAGKLDSFTPMSLSEEMHGLIPESELHVVQEGSHTAPIECPKEVTDTIADFLHRRVKSTGTA